MQSHQTIPVGEHAELSLKQDEERFRFLIDSIPHKIWTSGPDGKATYYNKGWYDFTGLSNFEDLNKHVWEIIHPDEKNAAALDWAEAVLHERDKEAEFRFRNLQGNYRWHLARYAAHKDNQGNIQMWVGTCTDIHDQKENEIRKDEFISIASHELKTPLTSIKAFNQLMQRANKDAKLESYLNKSAEHIFRLEKLIGDLLDVTKINAGKIEFSPEDFSFRKLLTGSIENIQYASSNVIELTMADDIIFYGDPIRLEQVINNLLSNAVKYSPRGGKIIVSAILEQNNVVVSVQDFGIGIARENIHKLFDRYYRVDNTAMRFEGLGLGLYISSEILKGHGGSFWIESELGKGSTFYFRLPIRQGEKKMNVVRTPDFYKDESITISFQDADNVMETDWTGFQDMNSVKRGCMLMLQYLEEKKCDRIVNDNTRVLGTWSEASDWVGNEWFPMMESSGLKYFAHIFSPSTFSQLSAKKSIDIMAGIITTQYFTEIELAREWIKNCPR